MYTHFSRTLIFQEQRVLIDQFTPVRINLQEEVMMHTHMHIFLEFSALNFTRNLKTSFKDTLATCFSYAALDAATSSN